MSIKILCSNVEYQTKYGECRKNLKEKNINFFIMFAVRWTEAHGKHHLCRVPRARHTAKGQVCRVSPWTHDKS